MDFPDPVSRSYETNQAPVGAIERGPDSWCRNSVAGRKIFVTSNGHLALSRRKESQPITRKDA